MTPPEREGTGGAARAAGRATRNAVVRAAGEIVGKLATLVLFAALARTVSKDELGAYVLAFAWVELSMTPIGLGLDRYLLRRLSRARGTEDGLVFPVIGMKLLRAVPVLAVSCALVSILDYSTETRRAVYVLSAGLLIETLGRSLYALFNSRERAELISLAVVLQRFSAAALGLAALAVGLGVVEVAATYACGAAIGVTTALVLLQRTGMPGRRGVRDKARELGRGARPFAAADVLGVVLARIDTVMLSLIGTVASVGLYGSAYRLLEATFFLGTALHGASAAMFTYLDEHTDPPLHAVYERALRSALVLLVPLAVTFAIHAEALCAAFFGPGFGEAADALRLLAAVVVLYGVVNLSVSMIIARRGARTVLWMTAAAATVNVTANALLIPPYGASGAALAMLASYAPYALVTAVTAAQSAGRFDALRTLASPLTAGAAMALAAVVVPGPAGAAIVVGAGVYVVALVTLERMINPGDVQALVLMASRRIRRLRASGR